LTGDPVSFGACRRRQAAARSGTVPARQRRDGSNRVSLFALTPLHPLRGDELKDGVCGDKKKQQGGSKVENVCALPSLPYEEPLFFGRFEENRL
jgi:hypothetical protein